MSEKLHRNNAAEIAMLAVLFPIRWFLFALIRVHSWTKALVR